MGVSAGGDVQPGDYNEVVQFGRPSRRRRGPRRGAGSLLLAVLAIAAVVAVAVHSVVHRRPLAPPAVSVTDLGHPILGVRAGWELFGLGSAGLVTVQFARGRIVRTTIPRLLGDGIVSLVPARGEVLVRPLDRVPGYVVPDGKPARPLTGALAHGGSLLPGPTLAQQWLYTDGNIVLVGPGGKPERAHLAERALLSRSVQTVISDGRGGLVLVGPPGTVNDVSPGLLRSIDDDLLLAVGPRNWLALGCYHGACGDVVTSVATGVSRVLPGAAIPANPWPWQTLPGATSPDGSTAAVIVASRAQNRAWLDLVSLRSGAGVRVSVPVTTGSASQSLAWSPDSRWLFVVAAGGTLAVVDARTGRAHDLGLGLSGLSQIAVRPARG